MEGQPELLRGQMALPKMCRKQQSKHQPHLQESLNTAIIHRVWLAHNLLRKWDANEITK